MNIKQFYCRVFPKIRYIWGIASITVLLVICIEMLSSLILASVIPNKNVGYDARVNADTYKEQDKIWLKDYYKEFLRTHVLWKPYVYWRYAPFKGRYININENGLRKTWNNDKKPLDISPSKRIFVFGGSTMWGTGARDDFTIPSFVSRILNLEKGLNVEVLNFGQSGYVTTQEVITLFILLQNGQVPDLVIFYDGVNDCFSAFQNREAGIPQNEFNRYAEFNSGNSILISVKNLVLNSATMRLPKGFINRLKRRSIVSENRVFSDKDSSGAEQRLFEKVIETYQINMRFIDQLAREFKFKTLFYWQPSVFSKDTKTEYEKVQELARFEVRDTFLRINRIAGKLTYPNFTDLSNMFQDYKEPLYIDEFHFGEKGNEIIARRMVQDIIKLRSSPN